MRSANVQAEEEGVELGKGSVILMLTLTLAAGVGIFFLLPLFVASVDDAERRATASSSTSSKAWSGSRSSSATCWLIGRSPDIRRVFQYHGAEHMTIHALEAGDPLTVGEVRKYPTAHQRCGTEFLVVVILLSIIAFSLRRPADAAGDDRQPHPAHPGHRRRRLRDPALRGAPPRRTRCVKVLLYPGLLVQKITTKQPTDDMIEVAIVSMEQALVADGESVPAGSADFEQRPMRLRAGSGEPTRPRQTAPPTSTVPPVQTVPTDPPPGR